MFASHSYANYQQEPSNAGWIKSLTSEEAELSFKVAQSSPDIHGRIDWLQEFPVYQNSQMLKSLV